MKFVQPLIVMVGLKKGQHMSSKFPELDHLKGNVLLIAFAGKLKSGKTESADCIMDLDPEFKKLSFATPLKETLSKKLNIDVNWLSHPVYKEEYREQIQDLSREYLEKDRRYFIKKLFEKVSVGDKIVIDDMRLIRELETVMYVGGFPYQIYTDDAVRLKRGWVPNKEADEHFSETDLAILDGGIFIDLGGGRVYNNKDRSNLRLEMNRVLNQCKIQGSV